MDRPADLIKTLSPYLREETEPGPGSFLSIGADGLRQAAGRLQLKPSLAMSFLLKHGIWPRRFLRNRGVLRAEEQARLLESRAAVIGCGGLGGQVTILLARIGLGALTLCDRDRFEETNLNRQLLCRETNLGRPKAVAAGEEVRAVASHVEVAVWSEAADQANLPRIISGAQIVVDCLDSLTARREVEKAAHRAGLPFVHGAIAGEEGFALITRPGEGGLSALYGEPANGEGNNAERFLGVPTITPAALACLQAGLTVSALLGRATESGRLHHLDLSVPLIEILRI